MTPEKEILIALFALRLGFVSREGLVAVVKSWARDPARGITGRPTDLAYLRPAQPEALADPAEAATAGAGAAEIGQLEAVLVPRHDVGDDPPSIDEDPHLPPGLLRQLGQAPGKLRADPLVGGEAPPVEVA